MRSSRPSLRRRQSVLMEACEKRVVFDATYHNLAGGPLIQSWTNTGQITAPDVWAGVPSIIGYRGDNLTTSTGVNPQTVLAESTVVDVNENQTNPLTFNTGGVTEFELTDPVVALAGSGTADAPYIQLHLDTTLQTNIPLQFRLRDLETGADDAVQSIAVQYRVGTTGNFTDIPAGFILDATAGGAAGPDIPVSIILPAAVENQSQVQIRIITTNAPFNDEWVGIDDISVGSGVVPATMQFASPSKVVQESDGTVTVEVTRTGNTTSAVSVLVSTTGGSATAGSDYTAITSQLVEFAANETSKNVNLTIAEDIDLENAETVVLTLSTPTGGTLGVPASTTVTIADNDSSAPAVLLNEIKSTSPGADNPYEYVELRGTPNTVLRNVYLVGFEGKIPANAGLADYLLDLSGQTLGSNGLLMVRAATGHSLADSNTADVIDARLASSDVFENDSLTFALIFSPAPLAQATDYDTDNDGTLDWGTVLPSLPTPSIMDAVGWTDGEASEVVYGSAPVSLASPLPGTGDDFLDAVTRFIGDTTPNSAAAWYGGKLVGVNSTIAYDPANATANFPAGGQLTPGAANTIVTGGTLGFEFTGYTVNEDAGTATVTVTRAAPFSGAVSVSYATIAGGTATAGTDYTTASGTLNWADNDSATKSFTVPIMNDGASEGSETVLLQLTSATGGAVLGQTNATLRIIDNDSTAPAGVVLSEVKFDPGTGGDQPYEYIEVRGAPGTTLYNVFVATFEGGGGTAGTGVADLVFDLSGYTIGTNGLLVIKSSVPSFTPAAGTTVVTTTAFDPGTTQSIENGANTVGLVYSPIPLVQFQDYDSDLVGDGGLDLLPSTAQILDSVGWFEQGLGSVYSPAIVTITGNTTIGAVTRFYGYDNPNDVIGWYGGVLTGLNSDNTYTANTAFRSTNFPTGGVLTPGIRNTPIMADANEDGIVDTQDFNILAGNFGTGTTFATGNFDGTGTVDSVDFGLLIGQYGKRLPSPGPVAAPSSSPFGATLVEGEGLFTEILA